MKRQVQTSPDGHGAPLIRRNPVTQYDRQLPMPATALQRITTTPLTLTSTEDVRAIQAATGNQSVQRLMASLKPADKREVVEVVKADYRKLTAAKYNIKSDDDYVARVRTTFNGLDNYVAWAPKSDALLDVPVSKKGTRRLRHRIEQKGEEQKVFFRWVSWRYHKLGLDNDSIVDLIKRGMDPRMKSKIDAASTELGRSIKTGGFNPRPMKDTNARYRLGTLSEHATGMAVDIDARRNPFLKTSTIRAIMKVTGLTVDLSLKKWTKDASGQYDAMAALDTSWAAKCEEALATATTSGVPKASAVKSSKGLTSEQRIRVKVVRGLLGEKAPEVAKLATLPGFHFLGHSRDLVLALRNQGLVWGATFGNGVDLHHFELRETPLPKPKS